MGEQGQGWTRYFLADPQDANPISVEVPVGYAGGSLVFADLSLDFPASETLGKSLPRSGVGYANADLLILRGADERLPARLEKSEEVQKNIAEGQAVLCLVGQTESGGGPSLIRPSWAPNVEHEPDLETLREIEMYGLLIGRKAILEAPDTHYEISSGAHVPRYVRLRNALESPRDCHRVCDWLLPSIPDGGQVVVAHRGLGALEATLKARLERRSKGTVEIHRLPRFDENETGDPHVPVAILPDEAHRQVVVLGVDTRTSDPLRPGGEREKALSRHGFAGATMLCLVDTTFPEPATEAFAHVPIERHHTNECACCDEPNKWDLHRIDVDDEIPERVKGRRTAVKVSKDGVQGNVDFWQLINRTGAAAVHTEQHYEHPRTKKRRRHRAVDLDVSKLLADPAFNGRCRKELQLAQQDDCLVLIPEHEGAPALKELAEAAFSHLETTIEVVPRLDPKAVGPALAEHDRILLLDDMIASGSTMVWLTDRLKSHLGRARFAEIDLRGFVILNCAPNKDALNMVCSNFTPGDTGTPMFTWCEQVPLPHPDERCPWCEELKRLETQVPSELDDVHLAYLKRREAELRQTPLRQLSPVSSASQEIMGSFIGNVSATTAFVRWASGLQVKRAEVQVPGEGHPPAYYFDAGFLVSEWQDWAQCAGVLRTASRGELRYTGQQKKFEEKWQTKASEMELDKLAEFAWAAIDEKLTAPSAALVRRTLEEEAEEDPAIAALAAMLAARGISSTATPQEGPANLS